MAYFKVIDTKMNFWGFLEVKITIFGKRQLDSNNSQIIYQNGQFQSNWYINVLLEFLEGQNHHFWIEAVGYQQFPN